MNDQTWPHCALERDAYPSSFEAEWHYAYLALCVLNEFYTHGSGHTGNS